MISCLVLIIGLFADIKAVRPLTAICVWNVSPAGLSEPTAEGGQLCVHSPEQPGVESLDQQEPGPQRPASERGAVSMANVLGLSPALPSLLLEIWIFLPPVTWESGVKTISSTNCSVNYPSERKTRTEFGVRSH